MRKLSTDLIKSGSFTGSFSGSVVGTITSASFASTASYLLNSFSLTTGSTYPITSSWSNNSISSSFSNTSISSSYSLTSSNLSPVAQDLIPISNSLYSLGSPTNKWKDLYVSTGSIYIGNVVLSTSGSTLYADVQPIVTLNTASGQIEISGMSASLSASYSNTSSVALNAISSSYSLSGSYVKNADISQTSTSSSYSNTSSVALNAISSSYGLTSSYSFFANDANNSSTSTSASYSSTASVALNALTSSYINVATNAVSSSFASTASISVSSSFAATSSYNLNSISSSYSLTASFAANAGSSLSTGSTYPITSSWATTSSNIIGGTSNYIPLWSTNSSLGNSVLYQNSSNIGIGTTSPADKLQVAVGNISVDAGYRYYMDANIGAASIRKSGTSMVFSVGSSDRVCIDVNGGVGIGTSIPASKLDVTEDLNGGHQILVRNINAGSSAYSALILQRNSAVNGLVLFTNSSTRTADGGAGNSTIRTDNGKLLLGAAGTTYHAIDTNGNVGIGTTSPSYRLQLGNFTGLSTATPETINLGGTFSDTAGSNIKLRVFDDGVARAGINVSLGQIEINTWSGGKIAFYRGTTQSIIIDTSGSLGIGTSSPNSKLEVVGNISASAFTGSHFGTSSWATNASTASYVVNSISSSYALTASYALNAGSGGGSTTTSSLIGQTFVPTASVSQLSLTQSVSNNDQILVILDGLVQSRTGSYTVSGSTLTLTENADSGSNIDVRFLGGSSSGGSSVSSSYALTSSFSSTSAPRTAIYRYGTTSVVNPGSYTNTIIKYDTAVTDSTGWYDNTNGRFTPTVAGWYQVSAGARVYGGSSTIEGYLALFKNGTQIAAIGGQGFVSGLIPLLIYFNGSTDYIQLYSNTSAAITNAQNSGTTPFTMVYMTS